MTNERKIKIVNSCVIAGVVFFFFMAFTVIYQFLLIGRYKNDAKKLDAEIKKLEQQIDETSDQIDIWMDEWKIEEVAYELGLRYPTDK